MKSVIGMVSHVLGEMSSTLLILGGLGLLSAVRAQFRRQRAAQWPTVPGVITRAEVTSKKMNSLYQVSNQQSPRHRYYHADVRYRYECNGQQLEGACVTFFDSKWQRDRSNAESVIAPYNAGQVVQVRYDPVKPTDSVLEVALPRYWRSLLIFTAVALILGAYGWIAGSL